MDKSQARKSKQLGMNYGTASARLQRMLLFKLIKTVNQHYCYRCGAEIETIDELSIDHKQAWLHKSSELFWDLDNIAFSHRICNSAYTTKPLVNLGRAKIPENPDEAWCCRCKKFLSKTLFTKHQKRWNGVDSECINCRKTRRNGTVV